MVNENRFGEEKQKQDVFNNDFDASEIKDVLNAMRIRDVDTNIVEKMINSADEKQAELILKIAKEINCGLEEFEAYGYRNWFEEGDEKFENKTPEQDVLDFGASERKKMLKVGEDSRTNEIIKEAKRLDEKYSPKSRDDLYEGELNDCLENSSDRKAIVLALRKIIREKGEK